MVYKYIFKIIFKKKIFTNNLAVVHGDTLSTLLGAFLIRRNKGKLVLLEAGKGFPGIFVLSGIFYEVFMFQNFLTI